MKSRFAAKLHLRAKQVTEDPLAPPESFTDNDCDNRKPSLVCDNDNPPLQLVTSTSVNDETTDQHSMKNLSANLPCSQGPPHPDAIDFAKRYPYIPPPPKSYEELVRIYAAYYKTPVEPVQTDNIVDVPSSNPKEESPPVSIIDIKAIPCPNLTKRDSSTSQVYLGASVLTWGKDKRTIPTDDDDLSSFWTVSISSLCPADTPEEADGETAKRPGCESTSDSKDCAEDSDVIEPPPKKAVETSTLKRNDNYYLNASDGMEKLEQLVAGCLATMESITCYSDFKQHLQSNPELNMYYYEDFEQVTRLMKNPAAAHKVLDKGIQILKWYRSYMDEHTANGGVEDPSWCKKNVKRLSLGRYCYMEELEAQRKLEEANYIPDSEVESLVEQLYKHIPDAFELMLKIPDAYILDLWIDQGLENKEVENIPNIPKALFNEIETISTKLQDLQTGKRIHPDHRYSTVTAITDSQKILDWFKSMEEVQYYATYFGVTVIV